MSEGFQHTRYAAVLEGAARDEARKTIERQQPEDFERRQLLRYVRQVARSGGYEALLSRVMGRDANVYRLSTHQWELLGEGLRDGFFTVGRGSGRAATGLLEKKLAYIIRARQYGLTEEGKRVTRGETL